MSYIKIDRYDMRIINNKIHYYAIAGKQEYEMPEYYKDMYDNNHLAIMERTITYPEVFDLPEIQSTHYIPLNTMEDFKCQKRNKAPQWKTPRSQN